MTQLTLKAAAGLSVDDLIAIVETLPPPELAQFVRRVIAIQTRRGEALLGDEEEEALLAATMGRPFAADRQSRLDSLREKSRRGTLTPTEQAELLSFVQQVERQDLARVESLVKLAQKRGVPLSALMQELGLETAAYA
jgi:hypothetical protein